MKLRWVMMVLSLMMGTQGMAADDAKTYLSQSTRVSDTLWVGGQPTEAVLTGLKDQGINVVISNRSEKEMAELAFNEYEVLSHAGVDYMAVPMGGGLASSPADLAAFNDFMKANQSNNILMHCRSGSRSGQLLAAWLIKYRNMSPVKALQTVGRSGDITPTMQQLLGSTEQKEK